MVADADRAGTAALRNPRSPRGNQCRAVHLHAVLKLAASVDLLWSHSDDAMAHERTGEGSMEALMAVWLTVGFFEVKQARVQIGDSVYTNSFTCIPDSVPAPPTPGRGVFLPPRTPLGIAVPPGPLLDRLDTVMKRGELLPYIEVRVLGGKASDVLRLNRVRVTGVSPLTPQLTRQVTIVADM